MCQPKRSSTAFTAWLCLCLLLLPSHPASALLASIQEQLASLLKSRTSITKEDVQQLRDEARGMFDHAFSKYMEFGFPQDEVRPISCRGHNSQGGIALTLVDALDSLAIMNRGPELKEAVQWVTDNLHFDVDKRVHVFELTIRALGGLLSTHVLLQRNPALAEGYEGGLLDLAVDLADRLVPSFDTGTGIPLSWINLSKGVIKDDIRVTCTACAGTLLLEFGMLSELTGNSTYYRLAKSAAHQLFIRRSSLGLVGNTIHCDRGGWERRDSGIGAGIDSYYEYLLKGYLLTGDVDLLRMFSTLYASVMHFMRCPPVFAPAGWLVDVHMDTGRLARSWVSSLGAFWPGLQALIGQVDEARGLLRNWTSAWGRFGWVPEQFDLAVSQRHPIETGYPLRPEIMESTYLMYAASEDPTYFDVGRRLHNTILNRNKQPCGFASVGDVASGKLEDTMESFFLSETSKYLFMLFSNVTALPDYVIFSTEGHLFFPFPGQEDTSEQSPALEGGIPPQCKFLCTPDPPQASMNAVKAAYPLVTVKPEDRQLLRYRRCMACSLVVQDLKESGKKLPPAPTQEQLITKDQSVEYQAESSSSQAAVPQDGQCSADATTTTTDQRPPRTVHSQAMCELKVGEGNTLACSEVTVVEVGATDLNRLPRDRVVLQLVGTGGAGGAEAGVHRIVVTSPQLPRVIARGISAAFGPQFATPAACAAEGQAPVEEDDEYEDEEDAPAPGDGTGVAESQPVAPLLKQIAVDGANVLCNVTASAIVADPWDACQPLLNGESIKGRIVVSYRGGCYFMSKAKHAAQAGAVGLIVVNLQAETGLMSMSSDAKGSSSSIPSVMVQHQDGMHLKELLETSQPNLVVSMVPSPWTCKKQETHCQDVMPAVDAHVEMLIPQATQAWLLKKMSDSEAMRVAFQKLLTSPVLVNHLTQQLGEAAGIRVQAIHKADGDGDKDSDDYVYYDDTEDEDKGVEA